MLSALLVAITLSTGQVETLIMAVPPETKAEASDIIQAASPLKPRLLCPLPAASAHGACPIVWLRPWTPDDLRLKPFEPVPSYCGCQGLWWCPKKEDAKGEKTNAKGDKKEGDKSKKKEEDKNAREEKKEEEPKTLTPLMQMLQCCCPGKYERMQKRGDNFYGWLQQGFTANFDSPRDRVNFGANFNWRSNDYRLNQLYFVFENTLEHEDKPILGYRLDFFAGNDAPFIVANGLFSGFTGFDPTSGFGVAGPASFRQMNRIGIDLPQFYVEAHLPHLITEKGFDIKLGRFYTLMGREVYPGKDTDFYSRTFENVVGTAYTHTGGLVTLHATDTLDLTLGVVRGWDVFEDNNDLPSYHNAISWTSCDKRINWYTTTTTGPEQFNNNGNYRTVLTSYLTFLLGTHNQWKLVTGGLIGYEANATDPATGQTNTAEWYDYSVHMFYTVDPGLILGMRAEWFRDDDGTRTAFFNRPGFAANFYDVTVGFTYKPYQNLRIRPELRFDWTPDARPYNDQRDKFQVTAAFDLIWEF